ncbi:hypothetical protein EPN44_02975 [bacterium]|nr:MAG: hypothetical protein EPN44_02975 [bacterium]
MRKPAKSRVSMLTLFAIANGVAALLCVLFAFWLLHFVWRAWTFALVEIVLAFVCFRAWGAAKSHWARRTRE